MITVTSVGAHFDAYGNRIENVISFEVPCSILKSPINMNRREFMAFVIGEAEGYVWKNIIGDMQLYYKLISDKDDKIVDVIADKLSSMDIDSLNKLSKRNIMNIVING